MTKNSTAIFNFHVSDVSRKKYSFNGSIFSTSGNVIFADLAQAKQFAHNMNTVLKAEGSDRYVRPGDIYAMGLIDEIFHYVFFVYRTTVDAQFLEKAYDEAQKRIGKEKLQRTLEVFTEKFPTPDIFNGKISVSEYLSDKKARLIEFEEMIFLKLSNENEAFEEFTELFDDTELVKKSDYLSIFSTAEKSIDDGSKIQVNGSAVSVLELLRAPMKTFPDSISEQLKYIKKNWGLDLVRNFSNKIFLSTDILKEENKPVFPPGGHSAEIITKDAFSQSGSYGEETENFSEDSSWMPRTIMLAKNAFVWLDQLSKAYSKEIKTLDQIPEDELKALSQRGFTTLWLIGLWERSKASKRIKQIMGNHDAVASAYSLYDYSIAHELGGEIALLDLKERAWKYGIRLASDMVPNHMAIDSKWLNEHPEWFVSSEHQPFPAYSYNGENLSSDPNIGIYIDDHYFEKSDAAVTFKRMDFRTGETLYVYHGNDGTCMPWNDTAQLNYLREDVREHVIKTIIEIAKTFPVIRFDAAMTLAKKHYHRLWFPEPGTGGDIASRSEHAMSKAEFNQVFPKEFWREVVDRVATEAPETLLLAEAFWLMEGYFVRTLGMHRVYNSAFMNFMKDEDNYKFRQSIKNVLEFDPYILERHVNFLNNPDEETAIKQFGDSDKYFGVTICMATLPGLPMFGHGQVEGFSEKYGMEYKRAYWNETINWDLVHRHEREVFPLMHERRLFAHVENFHLYDFYKEDSSVDENVITYSNRFENSCSLVIFNNVFGDTSGWINRSCSYLEKSSGLIKTVSLTEALEISSEDNNFVIFKDRITGLQYVRSCSELAENGLFVALQAYKYHVFTDFRQVNDTENYLWKKLWEKLNGKGCIDIETELDKIRYSKLHEAFRKIVNRDTFEKLIKDRKINKKKTAKEKFYKEIMQHHSDFIKVLCYFENEAQTQNSISSLFEKDLLAVINLPEHKLENYDKDANDYLHKNLSEDRAYLFMVLGFAATARLSMTVAKKNSGMKSNELFIKYRLDTVFLELFKDFEISEFHAEKIIRHIRAFVFYQNWWKDFKTGDGLIKKVFSDPNMSLILQINEYEEELWFNKESFDNFIAGLFVVSVLDILRSKSKPTEKKKAFTARFKMLQDLLELSEKSEYNVGKMLKGK